MNRPEPESPAARARADAAAEWLAKRDRGLSAVEQDEFLQWLADDPRHGEWLALHRRIVADFNCLAQWTPEHSEAPNPELLAPARPRFRWPLPVGLAATAAIAVAAIFLQPVDAPEATNRGLAENYERRTLEDGSTVELNRGAAVRVLFNETERRVVLERGEARFTVTKNQTRAFIVRAGNVDVRAVGTAFNVRLDSAAVDVLVTEGSVQLDPLLGRIPTQPTPSSVSPSPATAPAVEPPTLVAGQRATVSTVRRDPPRIVPAPPEATTRLLAWQPQLLDFSSVPLLHALDEFNRRNRVQFVLADPELAALPVVASIRSDNIAGFARFLADAPGVQVEHRSDNEIVVRRKR